LNLKAKVAQSLFDQRNGVIAPRDALRHRLLHNSHPIAFLYRAFSGAHIIRDLDSRSFITEAVQGDAGEDIRGDRVLDAESIALPVPRFGVLLNPSFPAGVRGSIVTITR
jgi:hypothetical protein